MYRWQNCLSTLFTPLQSASLSSFFPSVKGPFICYSEMCVRHYPMRSFCPPKIFDIHSTWTGTANATTTKPLQLLYLPFLNWQLWDWCHRHTWIWLFCSDSFTHAHMHGSYTVRKRLRLTFISSMDNLGKGNQQCRNEGMQEDYPTLAKTTQQMQGSILSSAHTAPISANLTNTHKWLVSDSRATCEWLASDSLVTHESVASVRPHHLHVLGRFTC